MQTKRTLLLNGLEIAAYQIVYGDSVLNTKVGSLTEKTIGEDLAPYLLGDNCAYDFDKQSATRLFEIIKEQFGVELKLVNSADCDARSEYEILVGNTDAGYDLNRDAYFCKQIGKKYVICGGAWGTTWHAMDAIESYLTATDASEIDLAEIDLSGTYLLKKVACLGDSITRGSQSLPDGAGFGAPGGVAASFGSVATSHYFENYLGYPCNLQRMLWKDYLIFNFGQGLATMRNILDEEGNPWKFYYHGTAKYASCLALSNQDDFAFDAVLIMLGTNDSGRDGGAKTWGEAQGLDYLNEAEKLLSELREGSPNARFTLMNVPHSCDSHKPSENSAAIRAIQKMTAETLFAKGYDLALFDLGAYTAANLGNGHGDTREAEIEAHADYYNIRTDTGKPDTTHPNYRGYHKIAQGVRGLIAYLLEDAEKPEWLIDLKS